MTGSRTVRVTGVLPAESAEAEPCERARCGDAADVEALLERCLPQLHAFVRLRLGSSWAGARATA